MRTKVAKNLAIYLPLLQSRALERFQLGEIETIAGHVADRIGRNPSHPLIAFARSFVEKATNIPNRFAENGEQALLDRLSGPAMRVIFDVGANVGTWSRHALAVFPRAELHAFEIVPRTFEELRHNIPNSERVHLNRCGLSDNPGRIPINIYESNLISSMFALDGDSNVASRIDCDVQRGADYAAAHGIEHIDVLKIDVEGAEGKVLLGFEPMIANHRVRLVQFEYNRGAILGDFLLKHAYAFFVPHGYQLGKLMPDGVHFHAYHFAHEDFIGPNYVACRRDDADLIAQIAAPT